MCASLFASVSERVCSPEIAQTLGKCIISNSSIHLSESRSFPTQKGEGKIKSKRNLLKPAGEREEQEGDSKCISIPFLSSPAILSRAFSLSSLWSGEFKALLPLSLFTKVRALPVPGDIDRTGVCHT